MIVTSDQLCEIAPLLPKRAPGRALHLAALISKALMDHQITSPREVARFVGQWAWESWHFTALSETRSPQECVGYELGRTGDRLYNVRPGDGYLYRGQGLPHLTGRGNFYGFEHWVRFNVGRDLNIMDNPEQVGTDLELAVLAGVWYWQFYDLGSIVDFGELCKRIQGSKKHMKKRKALCDKAREVLS
ncbi:MAG: hypothetical protein GY923_15275 [Aestuariibacter sp.]|nr:hypothetical protein [Aestuariibacter sp.]